MQARHERPLYTGSAISRLEVYDTRAQSGVSRKRARGLPLHAVAPPAACSPSQLAGRGARGDAHACLH